MRYPDDMVRPIRQRKTLSPKGRAIVAVVIAAIVVLALSARAIAGFYTDYLWFDSLDVTPSWRRRILTQLGLGGGFTLLFFVVCYVNLVIAERLAPLPDLGPDDELLVRYRELVGPRRRLVRAVITALLALIAGVGASSRWEQWMLFISGGSFGTDDPLHHRDAGFYVFDLPFLSFLVDWAFASFVIVLLVTTVAHYLNGGIRLQGPRRVSPQVKAHISVLLALLAITKAADYLLSRYQLLLSTRGVVGGATYTDVNAQMPALSLLLLISVLCAVLLLVNISRRGWALPIVAVGLWVLVALVAGELYPWFIQNFQVQRRESAQEAPYIGHNIDATRRALGLHNVEERDFDYTSSPDSSVISENPETVRNIRLMDPVVVDETFQNLEGQQGFYGFNDVDVDRYPIGPDGASTQVVISTRDLNPDKLPSTTWESRHLIYTHGYGAALAPANAATSKGRPVFLVKGVPVQIDPSVADVVPLERPELYYGQGLDGADEKGYAIVATTRQEQSGGGETTYQGEGGVAMTGFFRRAAFFLRFGHLEALTSDYLTEDSRVLYVRDIVRRARKVAPFLKFDADPYPVITGGRIKYVLDGYTTTDSYPYAQQVDTTTILDQRSGLWGVPLNYVRNSAKVVIDAYDGTVDIYMSDELYGEQDPLIRAYDKAFPGLMQPIDEMDETLRAHLRYPEDLFKIQTAMWGHYHIDEPGEFYEQSDRWSVAQDPGRDVSSGRTGTTAVDGPATRERIRAYYQQMKLPGSERDEFLIFRPFVPYSTDDTKKQLTSFMVAKSDPDNYGKLEVFTMTRRLADGTRERNRQVDGPMIVNDNIFSDFTVSQQITLLSGQGSQVELGNLLVVPLNNSLLYVRPLYVQAKTANGVPEIRRVVATIGDQIVVGNTLAEALQKLFPGTDVDTQEGADEQTDEGTPDGGEAPDAEEPTVPNGGGEVPDLIERALQLFLEADEALKSGGVASLSEYQEKIREAQELIEQAAAALGGGAGSTEPGAEGSEGEADAPSGD